MERYSRKSLKNIQTIIQDKTGVVITSNRNTRTWNLRRMATAAAAFVLAACVVSFPVRAFVTSAVKERMESIPKEEVQEMSDEEILEIIDFQHKMSYAVSQSQTAQEARAKMRAEENQLRERIQAAGGISEEEAIEIAEKHFYNPNDHSIYECTIDAADGSVLTTYQ